jgi:protein TonB
MKRTFSGLLLGIPVTFFLFVFMSLLVQAKVVPFTPHSTVPPTFLKPVKHEPPKPDDSKNLPDIIKPPQQPNDGTHPDTPIKLITKLHFDPNEIPGFLKNPGKNTSPLLPKPEVNSEAVPIMIVEPKWPRNAEVGGAVRLCFTIMPDGHATDIVVVNSDPGKVFVKSARRAVYKWKFRPAYENGDAVVRKNMCYTVEYNYSLDN